MSQVLQPWDVYLQSGWRELTQRFAPDPTAVVLLSYNRLPGREPRIHPLHHSPNKVVVACADHNYRQPPSPNLCHCPAEWEPLLQLLQGHYSAGAAKCLDVQLGCLLADTSLDQLAICWHLYVGHGAIPTVPLAEMMTTIAPKSTLTVLHCNCVATGLLAALPTIDVQARVSCGGETALESLLTTIKQSCFIATPP